METLQIQRLALSQASMLAFLKHMDAPVSVLLASRGGEPDQLFLSEPDGSPMATMLIDESLLDQHEHWRLSSLMLRKVVRSQREVVGLCVAAGAELLWVDGLLVLERPLLRQLARSCLLPVEQRRFVLEHLEAFDARRLRDALLLRSHREVQGAQVWNASLLDEDDAVSGTLTWVVSEYPLTERQREHARRQGMLVLRPEELEGELAALSPQLTATTLRAAAPRRVGTGMQALLVLAAVAVLGWGWLRYQEHEQRAAAQYQQRLMNIQQSLEREGFRTRSAGDGQ